MAATIKMDATGTYLCPMIFRLQLHIWNINKNILGVPFLKKNALVCVIDLKEYKAKGSWET